MGHFLPVIHWVGTKPLSISVVAQLICLSIAIKKKEKSRVREHLILITALVLIIASLVLRPPAKVNILADSLGFVAAILLSEPAVYALRRLNQKPDAGK